MNSQLEVERAEELSEGKAEAERAHFYSQVEEGELVREGLGSDKSEQLVEQGDDV